VYLKLFGRLYLQTYNEIPVTFTKAEKQNFVRQTNVGIQINLEVRDDMCTRKIFFLCCHS